MEGINFNFDNFIQEIFGKNLTISEKNKLFSFILFHTYVKDNKMAASILASLFGIFLKNYCEKSEYIRRNTEDYLAENYEEIANLYNAASDEEMVLKNDFLKKLIDLDILKIV